ncbi:type II toxin-antitoxin system RelE/ParE family toxin [Streptomyces sp. NPDC127069]|uniref:type II toxin-antitoxin system RelE/ParE family toxin n=1 Tax=Streptomyces sp. NPDC127069 TaxID=3347128 RepID=UPI003647F216
MVAGGLWVIEIEPEVREWLEGLSDRHHAQVERYVDRLAHEGPGMPMPRSRPLGSGLHELRFHLADDEVRVPYWFAPGGRAVLLTVFRKTRMHEEDQIDRARSAHKICKDRHPPATEHEVYDRTVKGGDQP